MRWWGVRTDWRRWDEIIAYSSDDDDTVLFHPDLPREEQHPNLAAVRCCCQYKPNIHLRQFRLRKCKQKTVWYEWGLEWRDTRDGNGRYDSYNQSRWPLLQMDLFQVNESEWCYCEKLICDILFSLKFFTLLIRLLLNSTVNFNQKIKTFILQSIHTGQFWSKIKLAT